jgi:hypothetical protein
MREAPTMPVIIVADQFGPICVSSEDGAKLCALIRESLDRREAVTLDFTGVTTLTSLFLNNAIGCLYASYDKGFLEEKLKWAGLDPADESVVRFVQRNAIRFYAAQGSQQEALIEAASRSTQE